ncbi:MAG: hypothetical protein CMK64_05100 [Pseudoalteromonas sp.]|nr:hypothetical protein [Pseudoalteromonas sp.]|tara:strand:- start:28851 stop:31043 length:2193 start_codon:yes stop_codon:yes gene_type:complete
MYKIILFFLLFLSFFSDANPNVRLVEANNALIKAEVRNTEMLASKLTDIKSATLDFYLARNRWPVNKEELVSDGFYFGNFSTTYGSEINYRVVGNTVLYSVDVNKSSTAKHISKILSVSYSNDIVQFQFGRPSQSSIISTALSKVWDGDVTRNTMETDLYLDGNDVREVNELQANTVTAAGGVYDEGVRVFSEKNLPNKGHVGLSNIENYSISNSYSSSRANFYASEKAVGDSHGVLLAKIEALTKGDIGLGNVPNYAATNSFSGNSSTLFATQLAVNSAYNSLNTNKLDKDAKAVDSNLLDGLDSSAFARSSLTINNKKLTSNITLNKADIGLGNVPNYAATNSFSGSSSSLFTTQKALNAAYKDLDSKKLDVNAKAADANKLDGKDSSDFASSSLKINGHSLTANFDLDKSDVGLNNVPNYAATNSYTGTSQSLFATQYSVNQAWKDLDDKIKNFEVTDADTLDGFDSSDFVKTSLKINGKPLTGNINITKSDVGLGNVPNYSATSAYDGNSATKLATQKAVFDAYAALNNAKLSKTAKAGDADKLDGIDSASFVQTSRTINGKNLGSNITITAADVGLGNVKNYGASSSTTSSSTDKYATSLAVKRVSDKIDSDSVVTKKYGDVIMMCDPTTGYAISYGYHDFGGKKNYNAINASLKYSFKKINSTLVTPRVSSGYESTEWVIKQPSTTGQISSIHIVKISGGLDTNTTGLNWSIAGELYTKGTCNE